MDRVEYKQYEHMYAISEIRMYKSSERSIYLCYTSPHCPTAPNVLMTSSSITWVRSLDILGVKVVIHRL